MKSNTYDINTLKKTKFGLLKIIREVEPKIYNCPSRQMKMRRFECLCDCGSICTVEYTNLRKGSTVSCGCFKKQFLKNAKVS